jgi:hypothetical protein
MVIPIHFGYHNSYRKVGNLQLRCCVCAVGQVCVVEQWTKKFHIYFIPTRTVARGYVFTWPECGHVLGMTDPKLLTEYETRFVISNQPGLPLCRELHPISVEKPIPLTRKGLLLLLPLILLVAFLLLVVIAAVLGLI